MVVPLTFFFVSYAETEQAIFDSILRGHIDFSSDPWPSISSSAKDLVKQMLRADPKERISAVEVLSKSYTLSKFFLEIKLKVVWRFYLLTPRVLHLISSSLCSFIHCFIGPPCKRKKKERKKVRKKGERSNYTHTPKFVPWFMIWSYDCSKFHVLVFIFIGRNLASLLVVAWSKWPSHPPCKNKIGYYWELPILSSFCLLPTLWIHGVHSFASSSFAHVNGGDLIRLKMPCNADHPWMREDGASDKPLDIAVLTRMKQFRAMNKLKKIALKVRNCLSVVEIYIVIFFNGWSFKIEKFKLGCYVVFLNAKKPKG